MGNWGNTAKRFIKQPTAAGEVLSRLLRNTGLQDKISRYQFASYWREIVGKEIALHSFPEIIRGGKLIVAVSSSVWAQELSMQKEIIINRVNRFMTPDNFIKDVLFLVRSKKPAR